MISSSFKERFFAIAGPNTRKQLIRRCQAYLDAVEQEAKLRETQRVLDVEAYTVLRRENSAVRTTLSIASVGLNLDLSDELLEDPIFMKMHLAAVDMVGWSNVSYFAPTSYFVFVDNLNLHSGSLFLRYGTS